MLELMNVHTHYGLSHVLQGVSIRVRAGEVVGLFVEAESAGAIAAECL